MLILDYRVRSDISEKLDGFLATGRPDKNIVTFKPDGPAPLSGNTKQDTVVLVRDFNGWRPVPTDTALTIKEPSRVCVQCVSAQLSPTRNSPSSGHLKP